MPLKYHSSGSEERIIQQQSKGKHVWLTQDNMKLA